MFKRLFWLVIGVVVGFSGSLWLQRRVRRRVERYLPNRLPETAAAASGDFVATVKAALSDGRDAMRQREAELHESLRSAGGRSTIVGSRPSVHGTETVVPLRGHGASRWAGGGPALRNHSR